MSKIVLIGGPPKCAKTTLAKNISEKLGISWLSTDVFDVIAKRYVDQDKIDTLFPKTALRRKSGKGNDKMYEVFTVDEIVNAYMIQAETISKSVKDFVDIIIKEDWDYLIEGYHITPNLISELISEDKNISAVVVVNSNGESSVKRSIETKAKSDWLRDGSNQKKTFSTIASMIEMYSDKLLKEARSLGVNVIDINDDFENKSQEIIDLLKK